MLEIWAQKIDVGCSSIDAWLKLTVSIVVMEKKLRWVSWATLLGQRERLPHTGTACRKRTSGIRGLTLKACVPCVSGFHLQGVHRF
jgi:hypothetical protein